MQIRQVDINYGLKLDFHSPGDAERAVHSL